MKTILVAVDGSAGSVKALDLAADLAVKCTADLLLVTATTAAPAVSAAEFRAFAKSEHFESGASEIALAEAETVLADARIRAQSRGAGRIATEATLGDAAQQIIAIAQDRQADLVVVGSRGHSQLVGLLVGSVAQKVLSHASCPVLVVR